MSRWARLLAWISIIGAVAAPLEIEIDIRSQSTEVLPLELSVGARPVGRPMFLGQVPTLAPFLALHRDARLWMRWAEPEETGLGGAQIEIAASNASDQEARVARVVARAAVTVRKGTWALYRLAETQGVVDLLLAGSASSGCNSRAFMHLLVCADLSRRYEDFGLPPDPFPQQYL